MFHFPKNYNYHIFVINNKKYVWDGWFGAQLMSIEYKRPQIIFDNQRLILGYWFRPVHTEFLWKQFKWEIHWCLTGDVTNELIFKFRKQLFENINE